MDCRHHGWSTTSPRGHFYIIHTTKTTPQFGRLDVPLTAIFPREPRGLAHNKDCGPLTKTFWKFLVYRTVTIYSFYQALTVRRQIFRITITIFFNKTVHP
jgi:hypothetical protein